MNKNGPVFVVGSPRSGTTLVAQLLSQHSDLFVYNETVFYDYAAGLGRNKSITPAQIKSASEYLINRIEFTVSKEVSKDFGCVIQENEREFIVFEFNKKLDAMSGDITLSMVFDAFMSSAAEIKGATRWGEKTPNHVFHMDEIAADFPDARFIHVIRDPRSFLKSYKFSWSVHGAKNPKSAKKLYHPYVTSRLWKSSVDAFSRSKSRIGGDTCIEVRYEDVVNNTAQVMNELFEFLGEQVSHDINLPGGSNSSFDKNKNKDLDSWEIDVCEYVCRKGIRQYGYQSNKAALTSFISLFRSVLTLPVFAVQAWIIIKRRYKGGLWSYLRKRLV